MTTYAKLPDELRGASSFKNDQVFEAQVDIRGGLYVDDNIYSFIRINNPNTDYEAVFEFAEAGTPKAYLTYYGTAYSATPSLADSINLVGNTVNIGKAGGTVNIAGAVNNINATDVYVPNDLEVDGVIYADGGIQRATAAALSIGGGLTTGITLSNPVTSNYLKFYGAAPSGFYEAGVGVLQMVGAEASLTGIGANTSTRGSVALYVSSSDKSLVIKGLEIASTGAATFAGAVTFSGGFAAQTIAGAVTWSSAQTWTVTGAATIPTIDAAAAQAAYYRVSRSTTQLGYFGAPSGASDDMAAYAAKNLTLSTGGSAYTVAIKPNGVDVASFAYDAITLSKPVTANYTGGTTPNLKATGGSGTGAYNAGLILQSTATGGQSHWLLSSDDGWTAGSGSLLFGQGSISSTNVYAVMNSTAITLSKTVTADPGSLSLNYAIKASGSGSGLQFVFGRNTASQGFGFLGADGTYALQLRSGGTASNTPSAGASNLFQVTHAGAATIGPSGADALEHALNGYAVVTRNTASTSASMFIFKDGAADICGITEINATANTTTYGTSSDARKKTDLGGFSALDMVKQIAVHKYEWKHAPESPAEVGVYAQELQPIVPHAVVHNEESDYWGVDYGKLSPLALKAIQELSAKLDAAEARIAAGGL